MNCYMAFPTYHKRFSLFCYHNLFPECFPFEIFHFVYVMNLVMLAVLTAAEFAFSCFKPVLKFCTTV